MCYVFEWGHEKVIQHYLLDTSPRDIAAKYERLNLPARYNWLYPLNYYGAYFCQFVILNTKYHV